MIDLDSARKALIAERQRLGAELVEPIEAPGQMTYGSQAAAASGVFDQQRALALRDRSRAQLELVDAAIRRLDSDTYGQCEGCGRPIDPERLDALPWAELCIDCQRAATRPRR